MKIKIKGPLGTSLEEVEDYLFKALKIKQDKLKGETYDDPAMDEVEEIMVKAHRSLLKELEIELEELLKKEL